MKRSELIFNVISLPLDFLMILFAASLAYIFRYRLDTLPVLFDLSFRQYFGRIFLPAIFLLILFALAGLYSQKVTRSFLRELGKIFTVVSTALMVVVVLFFFNQELFPSRLIILLAWILIIILVCFSRGAMLWLQRKFLKKGVGLHRLLVIVPVGPAPGLISEIQHDKTLGYEIVDRLQYHDEIDKQIEAIHRDRRVDELLQASPELTNDQILTLVTVCEQLGISFNYLPSILESHRANIENDVVGTMPIIRLRGTPLQGWGGVIKRFIDIAGSGIALILFSPLILIISTLIKLDSKGPVFFHQRRGSSFHNFEFYKFRTMHANLSEGTPEGDRIRGELEQQNARVGPYVKIKNDPRVTRLGKLLRKTKLDELPSLWHVFRGQMSLVGPRIHMVKEVEKFEQKHKKLFNTVNPGITGLAQMNQVYNPELPFEEEIKLDLYYIENWSVWMDLYLLVKTAFILFVRPSKGNY